MVVETSQAATPAASGVKATYACQVCHRAYERLDHLNRHLDSHRNVRSFKCSECPKAFNRRDLLVRHQVNHKTNATEDGSSPDRSSERAIRACDACVKSKLKCGNERPCKRCQKRGIACSSESLEQLSMGGPVDSVPIPTSSSSIQLAHAGEDPTAVSTNLAESNLLPTTSSSLQLAHARESSAAASINPTESSLIPASSSSLQMAHARENNTAVSIDINETMAEYPPPEAMYSIAPLLDPVDAWPQMDFDLSFPSFFESIMVPEHDWVGTGEVQLPPDLATVIPDYEEWPGSGDIFGFDFSSAFQQAMEPSPVNNNEAIDDQNTLTNGAVVANSLTNNARQRHDIFKKSPWLWKPTSNSHAFSEHNRIQVDNAQVDIAASPHQNYSTTLMFPDELLLSSRDQMFRLVVTTADAKVSVPTFPSVECLDILVKVGIAKRLETDAWIHPYTFSSEHTRPELLIALVAAGCVCFGVPAVNRTGLVLLEIARVALNKLIEEDNSTIRDLQYLQASMIWLDVCGFCGHKRKMEIAESNLQPLVTALRRFGKFDKAAYETVTPTPIDTTEEIEAKWRRWVHVESYKRLVHHLFEHDMLMAMAKHRQPLISYAELSLPLPASRNLWLAPTAEIWHKLFMENPEPTQSDHRSVRSMLADQKPLSCLPGQYDHGLATTMYLYGISAQTWEYNQQSILMANGNDDDASLQLWMQSRHQSLYQKLKSLTVNLEHSPATAHLTYQYQMMSLHVNVDTVIRFAGKCGEVEAHCAYQDLRLWSVEKSARIAIWHAGQLLRAAKAVPPFQIRGADAFVTYHALMVLWVYGMMLLDTARRTGTNTPVRGNNNNNNNNKGQLPTRLALQSTAEANVFLDDALNNPQMEAFLYMGKGRPSLRFPDGRLCELRNPASVLNLGSKLLENNCPGETRGRLPAMIESLCNLLDELGDLK